MSEEEAQDEEAPAEEARDAIVLLDASADPTTLEAIEATLGCAVRPADPVPLDPDLPGPGDLAIVVPLDLGSVSGLDLVESLRARAGDDELPIAVTSAAPTRRRIRAAMRAGATTWLRQPYEAEDWKERLGPWLQEAAQSTPSPNSDADPDEGDDEAEEDSA